MSFEEIILLITIIPTLFVLIFHNILKNKNNKFANFINKIWENWFIEQYNAIIVFITFAILITIITFILK